MPESPATRDSPRGIRLVAADVDGAVLTPTRHIAPVGDMPDDVLMFERSDTSIAMAHASADVEHAGAPVTSSNTEEGFALAMERFVLRGVAT